MKGNPLKYALALPVIWTERILAGFFRALKRLHSFAYLQSKLAFPLPTSAVVMGQPSIYGSGRIRCGEDLLLYPEIHLETQDKAQILIGNGVVLSRGVHLVAMAGITIGDGTMIGEYTSIRDSNHLRIPGHTIRDSGHEACPITIGKEVWIGRGVAVLAGVTIGNNATIGANSVVTHDVPPGAVVAGAPARSIHTAGATTLHHPASPDGARDAD